MNTVSAYQRERGLSLAGMARILGASEADILWWSEGYEPVPTWVNVLLEAKRRVNLRQGRMR